MIAYILLLCFTSKVYCMINLNFLYQSTFDILLNCIFDIDLRNLINCLYLNTTSYYQAKKNCPCARAHELYKYISIGYYQGIYLQGPLLITYNIQENELISLVVFHQVSYSIAFYNQSIDYTCYIRSDLR